MVNIISSKMPKPETLRKYYPNSKLSNEKLVELAEFVSVLGGAGTFIKPTNKILAGLIAYEESRSDFYDEIKKEHDELMRLKELWEKTAPC